MMTKYLLLIISLLCSVWASAQTAQLPLMPYPQQVEQQAGQLIVGNSLSFFSNAKNNVVTKKQMQSFARRVEEQTGRSLRVKKTSEAKAQLIIRVADSKPMSDKISEWDESYQLHITAEKIELIAAQWLGVERGMETLLQLIGTGSEIKLPLVVINDYPRFKWRGLLLDTSRHFFSVETIKRQIDAMAAAKYNIFHWHLTDDQGWRLESKAYPKLHKLASDGEYYTRKQIRDVVVYALERGIQVLPEIDMPGHASAIAVAYPELMSAPGPYEMEYRWGVHKPTLNPTNEDVYKFADAILAEVTELFPFEYIHIGGDEVDPEHWNTNPAIQTFIKENSLKDHHGLQAYFNQRLQKILQQHKRKMIGWDEIQHKDLPKDIVIQSWQGPDGVSDAVSHGFQAILSTGFYLDQPQGFAYHYRNDPIPSKPVAVQPISENEVINTWRFELPRKRGNPVTGTFTFINNNRKVIQAFVDFSGKSRREVSLKKYADNSAIFSVDTWMGPVDFYVNFVADKIEGRAIVGNAPYTITGEKLTQENAQKQLTKTVQVMHLSAQQEELILGGEAALWAEIVDEQSIDLRLWPRAFIVAERLWSARNLQDVNSMYLRVSATEMWAETSIGLLHRQQQMTALKKLAGKNELAPVKMFADMLEPAHYYHRQHEKSAYETYSKSDPLNRLVDALPAENEYVRQFNLRLEKWLKKPQENSDYRALQVEMKRWVENRIALKPLLALHPEWESLANKVDSVSRACINLLEVRLSTSKLTQVEHEKAKELIQQAQMLDQEMVVAVTSSLEKILNTFTSN